MPPDPAPQQASARRHRVLASLATLVSALAVVTALVFVAPLSAHATASPLASSGGPVGSGPWTADSPSFDLQECAGGAADADTFTLPSTPGSGGNSGACGNNKPRAERRYSNYAEGGEDYSTGTRQFGGTFTINSMSGTNICLKQTFNGNSGPYFMLAVNSSGDLYVVGRETIAYGIARVGTPVQINTIHDTATHTFQVYINDKLAYQDNDAPSGDFYDKIGAYETGSGYGAISVTWTNVHFWYQ
jgi:hypothetical protein